jgi:ABC-type nitrate/sulfonate/bicarbonate transport system substrate-binding protein
MMRNPKAALLAALAWMTCVTSPTPAVSQETLRAGKAVPESFAFIPLDVGVQNGIFKKHGLNVEITAFGGGARLQQAMAADSIDVGLGSGPEMAYIEKGAPVKAVAMVVGPPVYLVLLVRPDSPIKTIADLKGRKVNVSSVRSLTGWLVGELSRQQGWGPRGIELVNFSPSRTALAVMKTGQIDGMMTDLTFALRAEQNHDGKILVRFGDVVKDFHTHVVFATDRLIQRRPQAIRNFLLGWFETIAFMRANKAATVKVAMAALGLDESIASLAYDSLMSMFSDSGKFDSKALAALSRSYVELDLLPSEPKDMRKLYSEEFLPK